uniref:tRNA-dihydrouridine(16/17) synthase [NAD(P)(+)] n=1 Tax=Tetraselmis sp. GSL018 TaxID=582737 RepID=A0A061S1R0_9CHLO|eukprot:CAMPEP_0177609030 /NCGR_PEP_ID=MMETSP0419_2-20121207/18832_1 /TAXON_ID=582737 /ORGANISM="Tetraselmis sp., Strain GSL018" /LENGTH=421 /DNA_ID=CAMNT_0019103849 /DNA_START=181 /DNA_END=1446 /DNA_ORIENTATION=-
MHELTEDGASLSEGKSPEAAQDEGGAAVPLPVSPSMPPHAAAAWDWFRSLGSPRYHVAPMVDQSELAFRMLCRRHGAQLAYTPMLHSRLFSEEPKYRKENFTTCGGDRPVLAQFCSNDPAHLVAAAGLLAGSVDGVDLNLGCPQRIAKRGRYGAFLMDDLPLIERIVAAAARELPVPVTVKIRMFPSSEDASLPDVERTVAYARRLQDAGAHLLAIHGRTRDQKNAKEIRADWGVIRAVKQALHIPVIGNGNVRHKQDADRMMRETGADGVMSAEALLEDPALFAPDRTDGRVASSAERCDLLVEYLELAGEYPTPMRMVKAHVHRLLGNWLQEHTDLRDVVNNFRELTLERLRDVAEEMKSRILASGRDHPIPKLSERQIARMQREAAMAAAIEEQTREEEAVSALECGTKRKLQEGNIA